MLQIPLVKFESGKINIKQHQLKSETVAIYDVVRKKDIKYEGFELKSLLDAIYGKTWRNGFKFLFIAEDGYRVTAKIKEVFSDDAEPRAYLVYKELDVNGFTPYKKGKREIKLGPFYIVWSDMNVENHKKYSTTHKWPYQLKTINLIPSE